MIGGKTKAELWTKSNRTKVMVFEYKWQNLSGKSLDTFWDQKTRGRIR